MFIALFLATAPVTIASDEQLLQFSYSWSTEANAIPALRRRFQADAAKTKAEALKIAREDRQARLDTGGKPEDWNGHDFSRSWETAGQSTRLLSLEGDTGAYTGGAHPNSGTTALLWDRKLNREIRIDDLLLRRGWWDGAIRQPFCILLDRERAERRGEPVSKDDGFGNCPTAPIKALILIARAGWAQRIRPPQAARCRSSRLGCRPTWCRSP